MNIIRITMDEFKNKIIKFLTENHNKEIGPGDAIYTNAAINALVEISHHGFIFNQFRLYVDDSTLFKVEVDKDTLYVKAIDLDEHLGVSAIFSFTEWLLESYRKSNITFSENNNYHITTEAGDVLLCTMVYIVIKAMNTKIISVDETDRIYSSNNSKKNNSKTDKEYSLDQVIYKYAKHINHSTHNITCDHWEVKGHFRHYKNGKISYVSPYSKGKNKEAKLKDKNWRL